MIFRTATVEDLAWIADNSINDKVDRKMDSAVDYVYTLEHEGDVLLVGGFRMITPTTCWCWLELSHGSGKHIRTVYRTIVEWSDNFAKEHGIKRMQAFVRPTYKEAVRLVEHLGFEWESVMENFFGDEDGFLYKRIICSTK